MRPMTAASSRLQQVAILLQRRNDAQQVVRVVICRRWRVGSQQRHDAFPKAHDRGVDKFTGTR
jgi:hypothetical protein